MPYFAYGSNLNASDLASWCVDKSLPYPLGYCFGRAWLPDHQLVFEGYSKTRGGAVANVIPRKGFAVPGVMFRVMKYCWRVISRKEGAPLQYRKVDMVALAEDDSGSTFPMNCKTYLMPPTETFLSPSQEYLQAIADGYREHGLPMEHFLLALKGLENPLPVFVYGTLKWHGHLHGYTKGFDFAGEASIAGRLLNCGHYPGFVEGEGDERIQGELYRVRSIAAAERLMVTLDKVEGFSGLGRRNLYERRIVLAKDADGVDMPCWAYRWMGKQDLPIVPDGNWQI